MQIWELAEILDKRSRGVSEAHYFSLLSTFASKLPPREVEELIDMEAESIKRLDQEASHESATH